MNTNEQRSTKWKKLTMAAVLGVALVGVAVVTAESHKLPAAGEPPALRTFESPEKAATALDEAAKSGDPNEMMAVLGGDAKALITTGEAESDNAAMQTFASKYEQMNRWVRMSDGSRVLYIGADNFAFPVPLAKNSSGQWYFDGVAGAEEVRARDIGRNELLAIDACAALASAEELYFESSGDAPEYAQRIISATDKQDGLYWAVAEGQVPSPLGHLSKFPKSSLASYSAEQPFVIDGYNLRILTAQGDNAPGGAMNYITDGKMARGFAILATPVTYGETGIMTFMISQEGVVYERDFGPDTVKVGSAIQAYNPDENWAPVE
jgi:hypothetical protein